MGNLKNALTSSALCLGGEVKTATAKVTGREQMTIYVCPCPFLLLFENQERFLAMRAGTVEAPLLRVLRVFRG